MRHSHSTTTAQPSQPHSSLLCAQEANKPLSPEALKSLESEYGALEAAARAAGDLGPAADDPADFVAAALAADAKALAQVNIDPNEKGAADVRVSPRARP